jgi:phosphatidate phosphatase APP1
MVKYSRRWTDKVFQVYVRDLESSVERPQRVERFSESTVKREELKKRVQFTYRKETLRLGCKNRNWVVEPENLRD